MPRERHCRRARIVKERRATFAQIPSALPLRPRCETRYRNLFLAGDWVETRLPATIGGSRPLGRHGGAVRAARPRRLRGESPRQYTFWADTMA